MNSINKGWDSTKRAETPYFHCGPSILSKFQFIGFSFSSSFFFFFFFERGRGAGTLPVQTMRLGFRADAEVNTSERKTFTNIIRRCQCFQFVVTHFQPKIQNFHFPVK